MPGTPRKKATIAGPRTRKAAAPKITQPELDRMQAIIVASLEDDKAEDIQSLDLAGRASFADRMVIATGLADRQIAAMATHLSEKLHEAGFQETPHRRRQRHRLGADRRRRYHRPPLQTRSPGPVRIGKNVGPGFGWSEKVKEAVLF